jgi:hypothetical protein
MGRAYAQVLKILDEPFRVIGRGETSADTFETEVGVNVVRGGVRKALGDLGPPKTAIVCVQETEAIETTTELLSSGVKKLLVEKPGALSLIEIKSLLELSKSSGAKIWVAYNRRFYSSVIHARQQIAQDGGLLSMHFDFTEFSAVVESLDTDRRTKERWLIANSSHVIDLAFFLAGMPEKGHYLHAGGLEWHPVSSRFSGSGISQHGAVFSYLSDWSSPGRWGIELRTAERKMLLQPLEELKEMTRGTLVYSPVEIVSEDDQRAKPGLIKMTQSFLSGDTADLCTLEHQAEAMELFYKISGYADFQGQP